MPSSSPSSSPSWRRAFRSSAPPASLPPASGRRPAPRLRPACAAVSVALLLAGCGGGNADDEAVVRGDTLTIYSSGPRHGTSAPAGDAVFAGQRQALEEAGGRAGGRRIRLVRLGSTRSGDVRW